MAILGYILAFMMGLVFGLIGAGGSILSIPIIVYCFGINPVLATAYSLLIVSITACLGAITYGIKGQICFKEVTIFAIPAATTVWLTRTLILPCIPSYIFSVSKDNFIMLCFTLIMIAAAISMLKKRKLLDDHTHPNKLKLIMGSSGIGLVTGLVGAGGGFLILPSLTKLFNLDIRHAVATSLAITAINSFVGFSGDLFIGIDIDWHFLSKFLLMTVSGVFVGATIGKFVEGFKLRAIFAVFTLCLGLILLGKQLYHIII